MKKKELNFDLKQLRSYLEILQEKSFTSASRKLKIGQATISSHIQGLEEMLGLKLIKRTSKEFTVTPEGKTFQTGKTYRLCTTSQNPELIYYYSNNVQCDVYYEFVLPEK